jgi:hypothetical protein
LIRACCLLLAAGATLGCQFDPVDLGSNHPDAGAPHDAGPVTTSGCPYVSEAEIEALAGTSCDSTCAGTGGTPRVATSSDELIAATAGRWQTCGGAVPWPPDIVGIEFQNGCTLFLLHDVPDAGVARGADPDDQGTFNVITTTSGATTTRSLQLFFPTWTWQVGVTTSDCPHRMVWSTQRGGEVSFVGIPSSSPTIQ